MGKEQGIFSIQTFKPSTSQEEKGEDDITLSSVNTAYLYRSDIAPLIWQRSLLHRHKKLYFFVDRVDDHQLDRRVPTLFNETAMQYPAGLVLNEKGELYHNSDQHHSALLLCQAIRTQKTDHSVENSMNASIVKALALIQQWNQRCLVTKKQPITHATLFSILHYGLNHFNFLLIELTWAPHGLTQAIVHRYEPLYKKAPLPDQFREALMSAMSPYVKKNAPFAFKIINRYTQQQATDDYTSCGAISAENGVRYLQQGRHPLEKDCTRYPSGCKTLRYQHLQRINHVGFTKEQQDNISYTLSEKRLDISVPSLVNRLHDLLLKSNNKDQYISRLRTLAIPFIHGNDWQSSRNNSEIRQWFFDHQNELNDKNNTASTLLAYFFTAGVEKWLEGGMDRLSAVLIAWLTKTQHKQPTQDNRLGVVDSSTVSKPGLTPLSHQTLSDRQHDLRGGLTGDITYDAIQAILARTLFACTAVKAWSTKEPTYRTLHTHWQRFHQALILLGHEILRPDLWWTAIQNQSIVLFAQLDHHNASPTRLLETLLAIEVQLLLTIYMQRLLKIHRTPMTEETVKTYEKQLKEQKKNLARHSKNEETLTGYQRYLSGLVVIFREDIVKEKPLLTLIDNQVGTISVQKNIVGLTRTAINCINVLTKSLVRQKKFYSIAGLCHGHYMSNYHALFSLNKKQSSSWWAELLEPVTLRLSQYEKKDKWPAPDQAFHVVRHLEYLLYTTRFGAGNIDVVWQHIERLLQAINQSQTLEKENLKSLWLQSMIRFLKTATNLPMHNQDRFIQKIDAFKQRLVTEDLLKELLDKAFPDKINRPGQRALHAQRLKQALLENDFWQAHCYYRAVQACNDDPDQSVADNIQLLTWFAQNGYAAYAYRQAKQLAKTVKETKNLRIMQDKWERQTLIDSTMNQLQASLFHYHHEILCLMANVQKDNQRLLYSPRFFFKHLHEIIRRFVPRKNHPLSTLQGDPNYQQPMQTAILRLVKSYYRASLTLPDHKKAFDRAPSSLTLMPSHQKTYEATLNGVLKPNHLKALAHDYEHYLTWLLSKPPTAWADDLYHHVMKEKSSLSSLPLAPKSIKAGVTQLIDAQETHFFYGRRSPWTQFGSQLIDLIEHEVIPYSELSTLLSTKTAGKLYHALKKLIEEKAYRYDFYRTRYRLDSLLEVSLVLHHQLGYYACQQTRPLSDYDYSAWQTLLDKASTAPYDCQHVLPLLALINTLHQLKSGQRQQNSLFTKKTFKSTLKWVKTIKKVTAVETSTKTNYLDKTLSITALIKNSQFLFDIVSKLLKKPPFDYDTLLPIISMSYVLQADPWNVAIQQGMLAALDSQLNTLNKSGKKEDCQTLILLKKRLSHSAVTIPILGTALARLDQQLSQKTYQTLIKTIDSPCVLWQPKRPLNNPRTFWQQLHEVMRARLNHSFVYNPPYTHERYDQIIYRGGHVTQHDLAEGKILIQQEEGGQYTLHTRVKKIDTHIKIDENEKVRQLFTDNHPEPGQVVTLRIPQQREIVLDIAKRYHIVPPKQSNRLSSETTFLWEVARELTSKPWRYGLQMLGQYAKQHPCPQFMQTLYQPIKTALVTHQERYQHYEREQQYAAYVLNKSWPSPRYQSIQLLMAHLSDFQETTTTIQDIVDLYSEKLTSNQHAKRNTSQQRLNKKVDRYFTPLKAPSHHALSAWITRTAQAIGYILGPCPPTLAWAFVSRNVSTLQWKGLPPRVTLTMIYITSDSENRNDETLPFYLDTFCTLWRNALAQYGDDALLSLASPAILKKSQWEPDTLQYKIWYQQNTHTLSAWKIHTLHTLQSLPEPILQSLHKTEKLSAKTAYRRLTTLVVYRLWYQTQDKIPQDRALTLAALLQDTSSTLNQAMREWERGLTGTDPLLSDIAIYLITALSQVIRQHPKRLFDTTLLLELVRYLAVHPPESPDNALQTIHIAALTSLIAYERHAVPMVMAYIRQCYPKFSDFKTWHLSFQKACLSKSSRQRFSKLAWLPYPDGERLHDTLSYHSRQQAFERQIMTQFTVKSPSIPSGTRVTLSWYPQGTSPDSPPCTRVVNPLYCQQLFNRKWQWRKESVVPQEKRKGKREVFPLFAQSEQAKTWAKKKLTTVLPMLYLKKFPGFPGIQIAVNALMKRLGAMVVPMVIAKLTVRVKGDILEEVPVTLSEAMPQTLLQLTGSHLDKKIRDLDQRDYGWHVISSLLIGFEDHKLANLCVKDNRLQPIDSEHAFQPAIEVLSRRFKTTYRSMKINAKNVLYCFPQMTHPLHRDIADEISLLNVSSLLTAWLAHVRLTHRQLETLFGFNLINRWNKKKLTAILPHWRIDALPEFYHNFLNIQSSIKQTPNQSLFTVMKQTNPLLHHYYWQTFQAHPSIEARFHDEIRLPTNYPPPKKIAVPKNPVEKQRASRISTYQPTTVPLQKVIRYTYSKTIKQKPDITIHLDTQKTTGKSGHHLVNVQKGLEQLDKLKKIEQNFNVICRGLQENKHIVLEKTGGLLFTSQQELTKKVRYYSQTDKTAEILSNHLVGLRHYSEKIFQTLSARPLTTSQQAIFMAFLLEVDSFKTLSLSGWTSIDDKSLTKLVKQHNQLETLDVSYCVNLTNQAIRTIAYEVPSLTTLILDGTHINRIGEAALIGFIEHGTLNFENLKTLSVNHCQKLGTDNGSININAPELETLSLENTPHLERIKTNSQHVSVLNEIALHPILKMLADNMSHDKKINAFKKLKQLGRKSQHWLKIMLNALNSESWQIRALAFQQLGTLHPNDKKLLGERYETSLQTLWKACEDKNSDVRDAAASALTACYFAPLKTSNIKAWVKVNLDALKSEAWQTRKLACKQLATLNLNDKKLLGTQYETAIQALWKACEDKNSNVRKAAESALKTCLAVLKTSNVKVWLDSVLNALKSKGWQARKLACEQLGTLDPNDKKLLGERYETGLQALWMACEDKKNSNVRWVAESALTAYLASLKTSNVKAWLDSILNALKSKGWQARKLACKQLATLNPNDDKKPLGERYETAIQALWIACEDKNFDVRWAAASALTAYLAALKTSNVKAWLDSVLNALKSEIEEVRELACKQLATLNPNDDKKPLGGRYETATQALLKACKDKDYYVRKAAVSALTVYLAALKTSNIQAWLDSVLNALKSDAWQVRALACQQLGTLHPNDKKSLGERYETAIQALLKACNDKDSDVRKAAVSALTVYLAALKISNIQAWLDSVLNALKSEAWQARALACKQLEALNPNDDKKPLGERYETGLQALWMACEDKNSEVSKAAKSALKTCYLAPLKTSNIKAWVKVNLNNLKSENWRVREVTCKQLDTLHPNDKKPLGALYETCIQALWKACEDKNSEVSKAAESALKTCYLAPLKTSNIKAWVKVNLNNLKSDVMQVRKLACGQLGTLGPNDKKLLGERYETGLQALWKVCNDENHDVSKAAVSALKPCLAALKTSNVKAWLDSVLNALKSEAWQARALACKQLETLNPNDDKKPLGERYETGLQALWKACEDKNSHVRWAAASALKICYFVPLKTSNIQAWVKVNLNNLESDVMQVRVLACRQLSTLGPNDKKLLGVLYETCIQALWIACEDKISDVRWVAKSALTAYLPSLKTSNVKAWLDSVLNALKSDVMQVRVLACRQLSTLGPNDKKLLGERYETAIQALLKTCKDKDYYVSWAAKSALTVYLAALKTSNVKAWLDNVLNALKSEAWLARKLACEQLGTLSFSDKKSLGERYETGLQALWIACEDKDYYVRWIAESALKTCLAALKISNIQAWLDNVLNALKSEAWQARALACKQLATLSFSDKNSLGARYETTIQTLWMACNDKNHDVSQTAASALEICYFVPFKTSNIKAWVKVNLNNLKSDVMQVRKLACGQLGTLGPNDKKPLGERYETAIQALWKACEDKDYYVSEAAASALKDCYLAPLKTSNIKAWVKVNLNNLKSENWRVREVTCKQLATLNPNDDKKPLGERYETAIQALWIACEDKNFDVSYAAESALKTCLAALKISNIQAWLDNVLNALKSEAWQARKLACKQLETLNPNEKKLLGERYETGLQALWKACEDKNSEVSKAAESALKTCYLAPLKTSNIKAWVKVNLNNLKSEGWQTRRLACRQLATLSPNEKKLLGERYETVIQGLWMACCEDKNDDVRLAAVSALQAYYFTPRKTSNIKAWVKVNLNNLKNENWQARTLACWELATLHPNDKKLLGERYETVLQALWKACEDKNGRVGCAAASALTTYLASLKTSNIQAWLDSVFNILKSDSWQARALVYWQLGTLSPNDKKFLGERYETAIQALWKACEDKNSDVRWIAASALKTCLAAFKTSNVKAWSDSVLNALKSEAWQTRRLACEQLATLSPHDKKTLGVRYGTAIQTLLKACGDPQYFVNKAAASALKTCLTALKTSNVKVWLDIVLKTLNSDVGQVRVLACEQLGMLSPNDKKTLGAWYETSIQALWKACDDKDYCVGYAAASALIACYLAPLKTSNIKAWLDIVLKALNSDVGQVRELACWQLATLSFSDKKSLGERYETSIQTLWKACDDKDYCVRYAVASALKTCWASLKTSHVKAWLNSVLKALNSEDWQVKKLACEQLATLSLSDKKLFGERYEAAIQALLKAGEDKNRDVSYAAASALRYLGFAPVRQSTLQKQLPDKTGQTSLRFFSEEILQHSQKEPSVPSPSLSYNV